ncbi:MAG: Protoporphyrinogen IX oxidase, novel form, HemJ [uncultured Sphingosinicella sp.]|uniref:Protoporphyrinogen IX oxidase n=1 Tax=uncultured Sphingosinicella sp. TaxID=478748 RepID=A0A6J4U9G1_9SPHN|nr:CopD family protein [uncultured Sphingosinicella sp.]CAA9544221.1 MAG: Protoporphyrinogen IX oxidase, novel form, HemJ [uncultured Sphingosinicella sp.]
MSLGYELGNALTLTYAWIKAAHVIFVIFWIAGLFMLPRYYVYHQEAPPGSAEEKKWVERERKLRNIIITPAMALVWVLGLTLAWITGAWSEGWLHAKLLIVIALSGYHGYMVGYGKKLAQGLRPVSGKALRMMNEVPGIATVIIVILVIVKPF